MVALALALVAAACGSTSTGAGDDPTTTSTATSSTATSSTTADTSEPEPGGVELRTYDVDGATVRVYSALEDLPERATVVRFTGTLIDSGNGLELCLGGVAESLPPQCSGPVVVGLDPAGWTETQSGITWGERTVVVEWPPRDDNTLTLVSDAEATRPEPFDEFDFSTPPPDCAGIENSADAEVLSRFADANQDRTGTLWVVDNGRIAVLPVVSEHLDDVRAELAARIGADEELCLIPVRYSAAELRAAQERLHDSAEVGPPTWVLGSGSGGVTNAVTVSVAVADRQTVEAITALYDDPGILDIGSAGIILDGD